MTVPMETTWVMILAGGLGTRLRSVVADRPKVMALVGGRPFLDILVAQLHDRGVRRIALLLGHLHEQVETHVTTVLRQRFADTEFVTVVEPAPRGTAGALLFALQRQPSLLDQPAILMNGDTYVEFDPSALLAAHHQTAACVTLATQHVDDVSRYGSVVVDSSGRLTQFREKHIGTTSAGWINAGIYALHREIVDYIAADRSVSLESEVFPTLLQRGKPIATLPLHGHFVDFGTPASYAAFEAYLANAK
jgi:NDP-sugar pyrophosphorylase family protein